MEPYDYLGWKKLLRSSNPAANTFHEDLQSGDVSLSSVYKGQVMLSNYMDVVEDIGNTHNTEVSRIEVGYFACLIFLQFTVKRGFRVFQISIQNLTQ